MKNFVPRLNDDLQVYEYLYKLWASKLRCVLHEEDSNGLRQNNIRQLFAAAAEEWEVENEKRVPFSSWLESLFSNDTHTK